MKTLLNHGEKIVAVIVVLVCGYVIAGAIVPQRSAKLTEVRGYKDTINEALSSNQVDDRFAYRSDKLKDYEGQLNGYLSGAETVPGMAWPSFAFYPQPERPEVSAVAPPPPAPELVFDVPTPSGLKAEAQQGMVRLSWTMPRQLSHFAVPVRLEILRGASAAKTDKVIHTVDLAPKKAEGKVAQEESEGTQALEPLHATRRSLAKRSAKTPEKRVVKTAKDDVNASYDDQDVDEHGTYYYSVRLIAKLIPVNDDMTYLDPAKSTLVKICLSDKVTKLSDDPPSQALYASPLSPAVKAVVPSSFQIRLAGVMGDVPSNPDPERPPSGYSAYIGVRQWIGASRAWGETMLTVPVGKPIAGMQTFRVSGAAAVKCEFNPGFVLQAVRHATEVSYQKKTVAVTKELVDPETQETFRVPVLDATGQPVMKELTVEVRVPTLVALVLDKESGKVLRYPRRKEFGQQEEGALIFLDDEPLPAVDGKAVEPDPAQTPTKAPAKSEPEKAPAADQLDTPEGSMPMGAEEPDEKASTLEPKSVPTPAKTQTVPAVPVPDAKPVAPAAAATVAPPSVPAADTAPAAKDAKADVKVDMAAPAPMPPAKK